MKQSSKKEANITVMLDFALLDTIFGTLKNSHLESIQDYPQVEFLKSFNFQSPLLGIFLSKEEYEAYLKPSLSFGDPKDIENTQIDFESFIQLLLNREGDKKHFILRSSFLERLTEENALLIKEVFESCGFNIKFKIVIENLFSLLTKDFSSLFYQIPTSFRFIKIEAFFQNFFKNKIINCINGIQILLDTFDNRSVSFLYDEQVGDKNCLNILYEYLGIKDPENNQPPLFNKINPLFMGYMKSKLSSKQNLDIRKEAKVIKKITDKFQLKPPSLFKSLSSDSIDSLQELNEKMHSFLSSEELPFKKTLVIKSKTCNLRLFIPYIESI